MSSQLEPIIRPATPDDVPRMVQIHNAAAAADNTGQIETEAGLRNAMRHQAPVPEGQALAVADVKGLVVGYHRLRAFSEPTGLRIYSHRGFVDGAWRNRGIGSALVDTAERRLRQLAMTEQPDKSVLSSWCYDSELGAAHQLDRRGYLLNRYMVELHRTLEGPLPEPVWPQGLEMRPVEAQHLQTIWQACVEASADDQGAVAASPEAFAMWADGQGGSSSTWIVAWDGAEVAGVVLTHALGTEGIRAICENVCVRSRWRRKGLARAMLAESLGLLARCGFETIELDANLTNSAALGLYAAAGFLPQRRIHVMRRALAESERTITVRKSNNR